MPFHPEQLSGLGRAIRRGMYKEPKYVARLGNVYFLNSLGCSLRAATNGMAEHQLPSDVRRALRHLDRLEFLRTFIEPKRHRSIHLGNIRDPLHQPPGPRATRIRPKAL
jgi:hypothetical protein